MSILEKEIWITLSPKLMKHFEKLGYEIPKRKDKWGNISTARGTSIVVKIEDVPLNSTVKVTKICDDCGKKTPNQSYKSIIKRRMINDGVDRCHKCGLKIGSVKLKNNVKYEKSLEYYALNNNKEYLLKEFSSKNDKKPIEISYGSSDVYKWNCPKCGSEYENKVFMRTTNNANCLYCSGHKVNSTNCLATTHPQLVSEWHKDKNGNLTPFNVTKGDGIVVWWLGSCGHEWEAKISNRANGRGCPLCAESKGEKQIRGLLEQNNIQYEPQKEYDGLIGVRCGNLSYDFYLPDYNLLIEFQGQYHDGSANDQTDEQFKIQQEHDKRKRTFAERNNINLLEIWYWDFDNIEEILSNSIL